MSRSDMLQTIEAQRLKIEKYEKRLKDLIHAYKGLQTEKQALEDSLKTFSSPSEEETKEKKEEAKDDAETNEGSEAASDSTDAATVTGEATKIATLRRALATITQEKTRIETALTEDKKRLLNEKQALIDQLDAQADEFGAARRCLEQQISEAKAALRQAQCERECEESDHGAMLKELQQKLSEERLRNEHLQKKNTLLEAELKDTQAIPGKYQTKIDELTGELGKVRAQFFESEAKLKKNASFSEMEKEIAQMRKNYDLTLEQEQKRTEQAEKRLSLINAENEEKIAALEFRISELSAAVGNNEKIRHQDIQTIENFKTRISQLDQENTKLAQQIANSEEDEEIPAHKIQEKLRKLLKKFKKIDPNANFYAICGLDSPDAEDLHRDCKTRYESLREEFERYKLKAQAALKNKTAKDADGSEIDQMKSKMANFHTRMEKLQEEKLASENLYQKTVDELRRCIAELKNSHQLELREVDSSCKQRISDLETEMQKQRERTLQILAEKDRELEEIRCWSMGRRNFRSPVIRDSLGRMDSIDLLKTDLGVFVEDPKDPSQVPLESPKSIGNREGSSSGGLNTPLPPYGEPPSLYYAQELTRRDREIQSLAREKKELGVALREVQHAAVTKELQLYATIENFKEQIRTLEASLARHNEPANVEYLKNVFLQYILCEDPNGKQHMLKAIGLVLKLTQKELENVQKQNIRSNWWNRKMSNS